LKSERTARGQSESSDWPVNHSPPVVETMGQVTVTLNGRSFRLRCGDGDEARLRALAADVQSRIETLSRESGQAGDDRILVMVTLLITDELWDMRARLGEQAPQAVAESSPLDFASDVQSDAPAQDGDEPDGGATIPAPDVKTPTLSDSDTQGPTLKRALRRAPGRAGLTERLSKVGGSTGGHRKFGSG
jgi:cell division protein ZapA